MIKKLKEIKEGWINYLSKNPEIEELAESRAIICAECPLLTKAKFCSKDKGGCGCYVPAKVCCKDCKCPLNKW